MKLSCHVIEDLIPLYHDNVCSEESSLLVKEHLKECEKCRCLLSQINEDTKSAPIHIDDAKPLKAILDVLKNGKRRAFIKGTMITIIVCIFLIGGYIGLTKWKCIPVSSDLLEITEISQLSDGRIVYHLNINDDKDLSFIKYTLNDDGSFYMTPMRSVLEGKREGEIGAYNQYDTINFSFIAANSESMNKNSPKMTSCYIGTEENGILIWKEEMELPKANDTLEKMFSQ